MKAAKYILEGILVFLGDSIHLGAALIKVRSALLRWCTKEISLHLMHACSFIHEDPRILIPASRPRMFYVINLYL